MEVDSDASGLAAGASPPPPDVEMAAAGLAGGEAAAAADPAAVEKASPLTAAEAKSSGDATSVAPAPREDMCNRVDLVRVSQLGMFSNAAGKVLGTEVE